eukprot:g2468.t1 g2468   contig12:190574-193396(-)
MTSLPPGVQGGLLGTLSLTLLEVSISYSPQDIFARIHFWGAQGQLLSTNAANIIEFPLVGTLHGLNLYLRDASPLPVQLLAASDDEKSQPVNLGIAHVSGLCAPIPANTKQVSTQSSSCRTTLKVYDKVGGESIGSITLEIAFRMIASHPQQQHDGILPLPQQSYSCHDGVSTVGSLVNDMSTSQIEDKQSLLEELLDLCADDMTIPTVDDTSSYAVSTYGNESQVDPYDAWISRIVNNAASPPPKEFPSLASSGSNKSCKLREVRSIKMEISCIALSSKLLDGLKGRNSFFLKYTLPSSASNIDCEFKVCERQSRIRPKELTHQLLPVKRSNSNHICDAIELLSEAYSTEKPVAFDSDESVRSWLDGKLVFELSYCPIQSNTQRLRENITPSKPSRLCDKKRDRAFCSASSGQDKVRVTIGSVDLRDLILGDGFSLGVDVDLLQEPKNLLAKAVESVGSLSLQLSLIPAKNETDNLQKSTSIPTTNTGTQTAGQPVPSPHPVGVFLSNFTSAAARSKGRNDAERSSVDACTAAVRPKSVDGGLTQGSTKTASLKPVSSPPLWMSIELRGISVFKLSGTDAKCIFLQLSCTEPLCSIDNLIQRQANEANVMQSLVKTIVLPSQHSDCSWQVAFQSGLDRSKSASIIIQVAEDSCNMKKSLLGTIQFPLEFKPRQAMYGLPGVATDSWFDIIHPDYDSPVGKAFVSVALGTLRQVRCFSDMIKRVIQLQRWWRRAKLSHKATSISIDVKEPSKQPPDDADKNTITDEPSLDLDIKPVGDDDLNLDDTVQVGLIGMNARVAAGTSLKSKYNNNLGSSPDSLYEEWSQQSTLSSINPTKAMGGDVDKSTEASVDVYQMEEEVTLNNDDVAVEAVADQATVEQPSLNQPDVAQKLPFVDADALSAATLLQATSSSPDGSVKRSAVDPPEEGNHCFRRPSSKKES